MIVNIEMYFEYNIGGKVSKYRCYVPQHLEGLTMSGGVRSVDFSRPSGLMLVAQFANIILDLSNRKAIKDRNELYMEELAPGKWAPAEVSTREVEHHRRLPVTEFDELKRIVTNMNKPVITEFIGEYHFLSNFHPAPFVWDNIMWKNSEAAYQAAKSADRGVQLRIASLATPGEAKRVGRLIEMRPDWEEIKLGMMYDIVLEKFKQNPDLLKKLLDTGDAQLVEGNNWHDTFWGVCPPESDNGKNHLGRILMKIRKELKVFSF